MPSQFFNLPSKAEKKTEYSLRQKPTRTGDLKSIFIPIRNGICTNNTRLNHHNEQRRKRRRIPVVKNRGSCTISSVKDLVICCYPSRAIYPRRPRIHPSSVSSWDCCIVLVNTALRPSSNLCRPSSLQRTRHSLFSHPAVKAIADLILRKRKTHRGSGFPLCLFCFSVLSQFLEYYLREAHMANRIIIESNKGWRSTVMKNWPCLYLHLA